MLNHALLNDQIGFCTWPVLTTTLAVLTLEPTPSLNIVWYKAKHSLSFSLCFCLLKASNLRWDPLFPPGTYENYIFSLLLVELNFVYLHVPVWSRSQLWCCFVLALWKVLGIPCPEKWLVYALPTFILSFFDIVTVNMKSCAATLEQSLTNH